MVHSRALAAMSRLAQNCLLFLYMYLCILIRMPRSADRTLQACSQCLLQNTFAAPPHDASAHDLPTASKVRLLANAVWSKVPRIFIFPETVSRRFRLLAAKKIPPNSHTHANLKSQISITYALPV